MEDENHEELCRDKVTNIQRMLTLRKQKSKEEKQSENPTNYFLGILLDPAFSFFAIILVINE